MAQKDQTAEQSCDLSFTRIRKQGRPHPCPAVVMGNPGLLQKSPDVPALLPQVGGDVEQPAVAEGASGRVHAETDLALDHRWPKDTLGNVVCWWTESG